MANPSPVSIVKKPEDAEFDRYSFENHILSTPNMANPSPVSIVKKPEDTGFDQPSFEDPTNSKMANPVCMLVKKLAPEAQVPKQAHKGDAGFDLYAFGNAILSPHSRRLIHTGISIALPVGTYGRVAPRSGLAVNGIDIGAGVIDRIFQGEICVLMINNSTNPFVVSNGDRIAQLIIEKIQEDITVTEVNELPSSARGTAGFGSSGTK